MTEDGVRDALATQAAQWYLAHREGELTGRSREEFVQWLRASPQHVSEYLAVLNIARDLPGAARRSHEPLEKLKREAAAQNADIVPLVSEGRAARGSKRIRAGLIAASVAALTLIGWFGISNRTPQFTTTHGEQRTFQLPDASVVRLNSDSTLRVNFSRGAREVTVLQGQVYFEVAPDAAHPFRVRTKSAVLTALGTAFDVYRRQDGTRVTVTEGRVGIGDPLTALAAGEQAYVSDAGEVTLMRRASVPRATAWLRQEIAFEREPVAQVAAEFNRYNRLQIAVDDPDVGTLPISGTFQSYDVRSFMDFLDQLPRVKVVEEKEVARVLAER